MLIGHGRVLLGGSNVGAKWERRSDLLLALSPTHEHAVPYMFLSLKNWRHEKNGMKPSILEIWFQMLLIPINHRICFTLVLVQTRDKQFNCDDSIIKSLTRNVATPHSAYYAARDCSYICDTICAKGIGSEVALYHQVCIAWGKSQDCCRSWALPSWIEHYRKR